MHKIDYLNKEELQLLKKCNTNSKIQSVYYYLWINTSNPDSHFSFIDAIELVFHAKESLFLKINDDDTGLTILSNFDFELHKKNIETQFADKIIYKKTDVSIIKIWKVALQNHFKEITVTTENGQSLSNVFWIDFEKQKIEINFHPANGIEISEYDDSLD